MYNNPIVTRLSEIRGANRTETFGGGVLEAVRMGFKREKAEEHAFGVRKVEYIRRSEEVENTHYLLTLKNNGSDQKFRFAVKGKDVILYKNWDSIKSQHQEMLILFCFFVFNHIKNKKSKEEVKIHLKTFSTAV